MFPDSRAIEEQRKKEDRDTWKEKIILKMITSTNVTVDSPMWIILMHIQSELKKVSLVEFLLVFLAFELVKANSKLYDIKYKVERLG